MILTVLVAVTLCADATKGTFAVLRVASTCRPAPEGRSYKCVEPVSALRGPDLPKEPFIVSLFLNVTMGDTLLACAIHRSEWSLNHFDVVSA